MVLVVLVCFCKERLNKLKQSIKLGCHKFSVQETGHTGSSNSDHVVPDGRPVIQEGAIAHVRNEVRNPSEESVLLEETPTHGSAALDEYEPSSTDLSSEERRAFIDHHQPEVSIPNSSGFSARTQHSSGYHSEYNQTGSHEEIALKTMDLNKYTASSNTEVKILV